MARRSSPAWAGSRRHLPSRTSGLSRRRPGPRRSPPPRRPFQAGTKPVPWKLPRRCLWFLSFTEVGRACLSKFSWSNVTTDQYVSDGLQLPGGHLVEGRLHSLVLQHQQEEPHVIVPHGHLLRGRVHPVQLLQPRPDVLPLCKTIISQPERLSANQTGGGHQLDQSPREHAVVEEVLVQRLDWVGHFGDGRFRRLSSL